VVRFNIEAVAQCTMQHHDLHRAASGSRIAPLQTGVPEPLAAARDVSVRQMIETAAICSLRAVRLLRSLGAPPPARTRRRAWGSRAAVGPRAARRGAHSRRRGPCARQVMAPTALRGSRGASPTLSPQSRPPRARPARLSCPRPARAPADAREGALHSRRRGARPEPGPAGACGRLARRVRFGLGSAHGWPRPGGSLRSPGRCRSRSRPSPPPPYCCPYPCPYCTLTPSLPTGGAVAHLEGLVRRSGVVRRGCAGAWLVGAARLPGLLRRGCRGVGAQPRFREGSPEGGASLMLSKAPSNAVPAGLRAGWRGGAGSANRALTGQEVQKGIPCVPFGASDAGAVRLRGARRGPCVALARLPQALLRAARRRQPPPRRARRPASDARRQSRRGGRETPVATGRTRDASRDGATPSWTGALPARCRAAYLAAAARRPAPAPAPCGAAQPLARPRPGSAPHAARVSARGRGPRTRLSRPRAAHASRPTAVAQLPSSGASLPGPRGGRRPLAGRRAPGMRKSWRQRTGRATSPPPRHCGQGARGVG